MTTEPACDVGADCEDRTREHTEMKELIERLSNDTYQEDEVRANAKEAADELERLTEANKELIENGNRMMAVADSQKETIERLTAENAELREGLDGWHKRFLDCEVERDDLTKELELHRRVVSRLQDERDALKADADTMFEMLTLLRYQLTDCGWVDMHGHTIEKNAVFIRVCVAIDSAIAKEQV